MFTFDLGFLVGRKKSNCLGSLHDVLGVFNSRLKTCSWTPTKVDITKNIRSVFETRLYAHSLVLLDPKEKFIHFISFISRAKYRWNTLTQDISL